MVKYLLAENPQRQILDDLLVCFNSKVTSTEPTRIVNSINNSTTISKVDFILTNACSNCYESYCDTNLIYFRIVSSIALNNSWESVSSVNSTNLYIYTDDEVCFSSFMNLFECCLEKSGPVRRMKRFNYFWNIWVNYYIKGTSCDLKKLNWLHKNLRKSDTDENLWHWIENKDHKIVLKFLELISDS